MEIVGISNDNLTNFSQLLGEDMSEDVSRVYYNGIGALGDDDEVLGALVYELLDSESEEDTRSRICFMKAADKEVSAGLENYYTHNSLEEEVEEVAESFYELTEEMGAETLSEAGFSFGKKEDDVLMVTLADLAASKLGSKKSLPGYVGNIDELSILQFREAVKEILFKGHKGVMEDIPYLPKNWFDGRLSSCIISGGRIPGLFLIRRTKSGMLIPALLFAYGPERKMDLIHMIRYSLQQALKAYPPETKVMIYRKNASIRALADNILPNRSGEEIFFGTRKEQLQL